MSLRWIDRCLIQLRGGHTTKKPSLRTVVPPGRDLYRTDQVRVRTGRTVRQGLEARRKGTGLAVHLVQAAAFVAKIKDSVEIDLSSARSMLPSEIRKPSHRFIANMNH